MDENEVDLRTVAEVYHYLPGRNCGAKGAKSPCGLPLCGQFAKEILRGKRDASECPYLEDEGLQTIMMIVDRYFN